MAMRYRTSIFVAFGLLVLYFVFRRDDTPFQTGSHVIDVLKGIKGTNAHDVVESRPPAAVAPDSGLTGTWNSGHGSSMSPVPLYVSTRVGVDGGSSTSSAVLKSNSLSEEVGGIRTRSAISKETGTSTAEVAESTTSSVILGGPSSTAQKETNIEPAASDPTGSLADGSMLQEQFNQEYDALGLKEPAGAIYGQTLKHLKDAGSHAGFHSAALTATESWTSYSDAPPYTYSPYPEYNDAYWRANNLGDYVQCDGPTGVLSDVLVFSGHPEIFEEPLIGSYVPLDIDSNLCFERQARLGAYGYLEAENDRNANSTPEVVWDTIDWRILQEDCVRKNANRFKAKDQQDTKPLADQEKPQEDPKSPESFHGTGDAKRARIDGQPEAVEEGQPGQPLFRAKFKARTAILLRSSAQRNYTDNDLQNIRSLVTELSLRSGGEYTLYLMVDDKNNENPIWSDAREEAARAGIPKEFQGMAIIWNNAMMEKFYSQSAKDEAFHPSEWLPVQRFAHDYPQYDFFWNLELDYRYTGHHYNLFEKLVTFGQQQPRKGLWERNERFYIPSFHGPYFTKFRATVEETSGRETVWGAPRVEGVKPVGPVRPEMDPRDDDYTWGLGEDADFISLAPIFNPVNTNWTGKDEIWGYVGAEDTPRRATVGMDSRLSKKLLTTMDEENQRGNYIGSEMGPQTVALLHGLKAVYPPVPLFFDRSWNGSILNKFLNPGLKGESGGTVESPFSEGAESRFEGSTWYEKAVVPKRLYNNWMGWEYRGVGGPEWEKAHGRTCLPPMLLHPVADVVKPPPDHSS